MSTIAAPSDIVTLASSYSQSETVTRLTNTAKAKKLIVFAAINFAQDAANVGLSLSETQLLIVGNPTGGTPAIQAVPLTALDLPLKILIWTDANSKVWVSYNAPGYLKERYGLSDELAKPLSGIGTLISGALTSD